MLALGAVLLVATAVSPPGAPGWTNRAHEASIGAGAASNGPYLLFTWTSPRRVGVYFRTFLAMEDASDPRANATVVDESAGDFGVAVRIRPWLTVGAGYGFHDQTLTTYGDRDPFFGVPIFVGEEEDNRRGLSALGLFTFKSKSNAVAFNTSVTLSPAGAGAAIGMTFGR